METSLGIKQKKNESSNYVNVNLIMWLHCQL